jgi:tetratricopeptide (TPR) repeat protein
LYIYLKLRFVDHLSSNMNSASQQAILGNNAAASQIEGGEYQAAIENLSAAVGTFRCLLRRAESQIEARCIDITIDGCMVDASPPNSTETQFLYQHSIRIPENKVFGTTYGESSMIASMVVFNLALAHHLKANRMDHRQGGCYQMHEKNHADLRKARQLYELSLNLRHDAKRFTSPGKRNNDVFFTLAIFNNLGLVHRRLLNQEASLKCLQHVLSTLMCLTDAGYAHRLSSTLDGFFVNVAPLISTTSVAQAA